MESSGGKWWVTSRGKRSLLWLFSRKFTPRRKSMLKFIMIYCHPTPRKGPLFLRAGRKRAHWDGKFQTTNRSLPNYFVSEWEGNKIKWHFWVQLANNFRLWPRPDKTRHPGSHVPPKIANVWRVWALTKEPGRTHGQLLASVLLLALDLDRRAEL